MSNAPSPSVAPRIRNDRQLHSLKRGRIRGAGSRLHRVRHCLPKSPPAFETLPPLPPRFVPVIRRLFAVPALEVGAARLAANEACCGVCHTQGDFVSLAPVPDECS